MSLVEQMREVRTLDDGFPVYSQAKISIREFDPNEVRPISKYVLRDSLVRLGRTREEWHSLTDISEIDGQTIAPPVVENDGEVDCIVDGLHRFTVAKIKGLKVRAIYIEGASAERPIIGRPVEWCDLQIRRSKPEIAEECRDLRVEDKSEILRKHYRDFGFMGSNGRRPRNGQNG